VILPEQDAASLLSEARREIARRSLLDFGRRCSLNFKEPPHIRYMAEQLEAIERGDVRQLMINLPPRHGKSILCSQIFPAWWLGRHPEKNVIIATHSAELSERNSRNARAFLEDTDRWPFETRLSTDSTAVYRWNLDRGGGLYAIGVGGSITGRGADVLILDDVQHDAGSGLERAAIEEWFMSVAVPRLEPNAAIVCIGTRFIDDDIFGRILESGYAKSWKFVRIPAIAEEEDVLHRAPGAALWPGHMPLRELLERREQMGSRVFEAQFQQNPLPAEGGLIKSAWLEARYMRIPDGAKVIMSLDAAAKTGLANDYSVIAVLASDDSRHYLIDIIRRKVDFPDLRRMLLAAYEAYHPSTIYIEDASNATPLIQELRRDTYLPIVASKPLGSKIARLEAVSGTIEAGKLLLPDDRTIAAPWLTEFLREILAFPGGRHDDQVDALVLALTQVVQREYVYAGWA